MTLVESVLALGVASSVVYGTLTMADLVNAEVTDYQQSQDENIQKILDYRKITPCQSQANEETI